MKNRLCLQAKFLNRQKRRHIFEALESRAMMAVARDASFGNMGGIVVPIFSASPAVEQSDALAIQSDGKVLVAGTLRGLGAATDTSIGIARYNTDGSLDSLFDGDGLVTTGVVGDRSTSVAGITVQADGKILVVVNVNSDSLKEFQVHRFNADGSVDLTFDTDGIVHSTANKWINAIGATVLADGKILVMCQGYDDNATDPTKSDFALVRYNVDGTLDTTYDTDGVFFASIRAGDDAPTAFTVQTDGKIVVVGKTTTAANGNDVAMLRVDDEGAVDGTFGVNGIVSSFNSATDDVIGEVAVAADGKITVVGVAKFNVGGTSYTLIGRYNSNGTRDTTLDGDGRVVVAFNPASISPLSFEAFQTPTDFEVLDNGRILITGNTVTTMPDGHLPPVNKYYLVRYLADGTLDTSFDNDGNYVSGQNAAEYTKDLAINADGKMLLATSSQGTNGSFRFHVTQFVDQNAVPVINPQRFAVSDLDVGGPAFGKVVATDFEGGVTYAITGGDGNESKFAINAQTGELTLLGVPADFTNPSYTIEVTVTDESGSTANAAMTVVFGIIVIDEITSDFTIIGTQQDDELTIKRGINTNEWIITSSTSLINGTDASFTFVQVNPRFDIKMNGGADTLTIKPGVIELLIINMGEGDDKLLLGSDATVAANNNAVDPQYGAEGYLKINQNLMVEMEGGNDQIIERYTDINSTRVINMGDGNDLYDHYGGISGVASFGNGTFNFSGGAGDDQFKLGYFTLGTSANIELGAGNDLLSIYASHFQEVAGFDGGADSDTLALDVNRFDGSLKVDAGDGSDYVLFSRSVFGTEAKLIAGFGFDSLFVGKYIAGLDLNGNAVYSNGGSTGASMIIYTDQSADGGDRDVAQVAANVFEDFFADFGAGDDDFTLESNLFSGVASINGGTGNNRLKAIGNSPFVRVNFVDATF